MKILDRLEEWIIATLMAAATLVVFVAVVHRYLSGLAIPGLQDYLISLNTSWAQELCIYMGVWMAKFGAAYGVRTGIHVGVDVLVNRLSEKNRKKMVGFALLAGATFTGLIGTLGAIFVYKMYHTSSTSPDLEIPIVDRVSGGAAGLLPDVLPLPASAGALLPHRRIAYATTTPMSKAWMNKSIQLERGSHERPDYLRFY